MPREGHSRVTAQSTDRQTWATTGELLNFSVPQFPLLQNGHANTTLLGLPRGLNKKSMYNT